MRHKRTDLRINRRQIIETEKKSVTSIRCALLFRKIVRIKWQPSLTVRTHLLVLIGDAHEKGGRADRAEFAGRLVVFMYLIITVRVSIFYSVRVEIADERLSRVAEKANPDRKTTTTDYLPGQASCNRRA